MPAKKIEQTTENIQIFRIESLDAPFAPWKREDRGQQVYIKLTKEQETALLYVGEHCVLDADVQQSLLRLVNEGWYVEGELTISFEGKEEPGVDPYVYQDPITVELGTALLPLVDPQHKAPLLSYLPAIRDEIGRESGLVPAGVHVRDNLQTEANRYVVLLRNSPIATGEVFLERVLAVGSHEQLNELVGWSTVEPAFRMPAKWLEPDSVEKAKQLGCLVLDPLQVLLTHLKQIILKASPELLGLQDTYNLISRLKVTHPVVVEDFLTNRANLRCLRRVMRSLLSENVPVSDLVTILETTSEGLDAQLLDVEIIECCRRALARQICWSHINGEAELRGLVLSPNLESVLHELTDTNTTVSSELSDAIVTAVRKALETANTPPVVFTEPETRPLLRRLVASSIPALSILSTAEIAPGVHVIVNGSIDLPKDATASLDEAEVTSTETSPAAAPEKPAKEADKTRPEGLFGFLKGSPAGDKGAGN